MGMDPLDKEEEYEVTLILKGPMKKKALRAFRGELDKFIDACEKIETGFEETPASGSGPNIKLKLRVREGRSGVRRSIS